MRSLSILEALVYLKENPADLNLASGIAACFDDRLDELEGIVPRNIAQANALEEEIDAISEFADLMMAVQDECKAYARAVRVNANADDTNVQEVLQELEGYLNAYERSFQGLDKLSVEI